MPQKVRSARFHLFFLQDGSDAYHSRYLYVLILALDACFRLKWRIISSESKDPGLGTGWGYFVEDEPYREYILSVTDQDEVRFFSGFCMFNFDLGIINQMSTCSGLAALDHANSKFSRGYATTGVGVGLCARHEFIQKNGVGDLQKGERCVLYRLSYFVYA